MTRFYTLHDKAKASGLSSPGRNNHHCDGLLMNVLDDSARSSGISSTMHNDVRSSELATQAPLLLYLPGLDGTGRLLFRQTRLWSRFRVECASYPQDQVRTYDQLADEAAERIERLGDGRPVIVLAESFGGAVALTLALKRPELISRLVLSNTFAYFPRRVRIGVGAWFGKFLPSWRAPIASRGIRGPAMFGLGVPKEIRSEFFEQTADVPMDICGHRLTMIAKLDLRSRLCEIKIPTLVLVGTQDLVVAPSAGRELARLLPNARLIERPVGHVAIVHPLIDVAELLDNPALWPEHSSLQS